MRWGAAKGLTIEPYGLDIVPELVELARSRLPRWKERIYVGNIRTWKPETEPFDMVLIRPEYAPPGRRSALVHHVIDAVVAPRGRLIVLLGTQAKDKTDLSDLFSGNVPVHGRVDVPHSQDDRLVRRLIWIDKPAGA